MGFIANFIPFPTVQKFENLLTFDNVTESLKVGTFLRHSVHRINNTRGSAIAEEPHDALRQLKYYGRFLTELLTRSSANPEEPCEHNVS